MTTFEYGDVVLVEFPETSGSRRKRRPALVIADIGDDDIVLAPITTRMRNSTGDHAITESESAGLIKESCVRLAKISTLEKSLISKKLGRLAAKDFAAVSDAWHRVFVLR